MLVWVGFVVSLGLTYGGPRIKAFLHHATPLVDDDTWEFPDRASWENTTVLFGICNPDDNNFFDYGIHILKCMAAESTFL